jgi:hypothetical protein
MMQQMMHEMVQSCAKMCVSHGTFCEREPADGGFPRFRAPSSSRAAARHRFLSAENDAGWCSPARRG